MTRVFIFSNHSLFSQGIKTLLDAEASMEVVGWETDPVKAVACIQIMQPDAILVISKGRSNCLTPDGRLFLRAGGKAKIIELQLDDNNVSVYCGEQVVIQEVSDLIRMIEDPFTAFPEPLLRMAPDEDLKGEA